MSAAIKVADLHVEYTEGAHALRGVSLAVAPGEVVAVVGESGSGKSTLLRAMMGLLPDSARTAGSVRVGDEHVLGRRDRDLARLRGRQIAFVPQNPFHAVDPLRRVGEHLRDAAAAHGRRMSWDEVRARLESVHLAAEFADGRAYPHQWSGGMLQRACIAAALVHNPPVLLADEPTSALDRATRDAVLNEMLAEDRAIVIVSHDLAVAAAVAHRVAVLYHGRVVEAGPTDRIVAAPRHPYTAALLAAARPADGGGLPEELEGSPPSLRDPDRGCAFAPRCARRTTVCSELPAAIDALRCHHPLVSEGGPA